MALISSSVKSVLTIAITSYLFKIPPFGSKAPDQFQEQGESLLNCERVFYTIQNKKSRTITWWNYNKSYHAGLVTFRLRRPASRRRPRLCPIGYAGGEPFLLLPWIPDHALRGSATRFDRPTQQPSFVPLWRGQGEVGFVFLFQYIAGSAELFHSWGLMITLIEYRPSDTSLKPFTISVKGSR